MRSPTFSPRSTATMHGAAVGVFGVSLMLFACGGGGSSSAAVGTLTLRMLWEQATRPTPGAARAFEGTAVIPPSAQTIEVRITGPGRPTIRAFSNPSTRQVVVGNLAVGVVTVQVFAYDVPFNDQDQIVQFGLPPSFESDPAPVQIAPYQSTSADFVLSPQPFATGFQPAPGATDVAVRAPVFFLIVTAGSGIDRGSINVGIGGVPVVIGGESQAGASLVPCDDTGDQPCSAGPSQGLVGYAVEYETPTSYPADSSVAVAISASDTQGRPLGFSYSFMTGAVPSTSTPTAALTLTSTPTAVSSTTPTHSPTSAPPPTSTPSPTGTQSATLTPTAASSPTATQSATLTPTAASTPTATRSATVTATGSPTQTATRSATAPPTATASRTATATATSSRTATATASSSATRTATPTAPPTSSPTQQPTPTGTATPVASSTPTGTATPVASSTPTGTATSTATVVNTETPTPAPSGTPTATPSLAETATPTVTPTPSPTGARRVLALITSPETEPPPAPGSQFIDLSATWPARLHTEEVAG